MIPGGVGQEEEMAEEARLARLHYVSDTEPGILRASSPGGFHYILPDGGALTDPTHLARIEALHIPPAWTNVWISPRANGHLQATGRDAKGRKQYRYHARWRAVRDDTKYRRMLDFGDVNDYLREISLRDFTAKDFRTWAGTVVAACSLWEAGTAESEPRARVVAAIRAAASHLGNTPAVCKKSYVHPAILTAYLDGTLFQDGAEESDPASLPSALRREEAWVLSLLRRITPVEPQDRNAVEQRKVA